MAAGDRLLDPDGNVILDDAGNVQISDGVGDPCCCCANFIQARKCSDDTDADLWFCQHVDGTIKCVGGDNQTLPYNFVKSGVHYYVDDACNTNATPGTLCTGETPEDFCPGSTCAACSSTPKHWVVTFSGITLCTCVLGGSSYQSGTGSIDGTYTLTQDGTNPCLWRATVTVGATFSDYSNNPACSSPVATDNTMGICLEVISGNVFVNAYVGASTGGTNFQSAMLFGGSKAVGSPACTVAVTGITNNQILCGNSYSTRTCAVGAFSFTALGSGGTVTATPGVP